MTKELTVDNGGLRYNPGKLRWDLLPLPVVEEVLKVYAKGAEKYEPWNWYRGFPYSTSYNSGQRHKAAWWQGEDFDKETGLHHLAHCIVNDMFNLTFQLEGRKDLDDRIRFKIQK